MGDNSVRRKALRSRKEYLAAYETALAAAKTPDELVAAMKGKYGDLALDVILTIGAQAAIKAAQ